MKSWMRLLAQQQGPETYSFVRREKGAVRVGGSGGQKKTGRGGGAVLVKLHGETHEGFAVLGGVGWDGCQFDVSGPELGKEFSFDINGRGNRDVVLGGTPRFDDAIVEGIENNIVTIDRSQCVDRCHERGSRKRGAVFKSDLVEIAKPKGRNAMPGGLNLCICF